MGSSILSPSLIYSCYDTGTLYIHLLEWYDIVGWYDYVRNTKCIKMPFDIGNGAEYLESPPLMYH